MAGRGRTPATRIRQNNQFRHFFHQNFVQLDELTNPLIGGIILIESEVNTMKQLIDLRCYVSVNGEDYCDTSIWRRVRYLDVVGETEEIITDWQTAYETIENNKVLNAYTSTTFWKKHPTIVIHYGDIYRNDSAYSEKEFKSLRYKWVAKPVERIYTFKELADELPADQFCAWVKDQGISINFDIGG